MKCAYRESNYTFLAVVCRYVCVKWRTMQTSYAYAPKIAQEEGEYIKTYKLKHYYLQRVCLSTLSMFMANGWRSPFTVRQKCKLLYKNKSNYCRYVHVRRQTPLCNIVLLTLYSFYTHYHMIACNLYFTCHLYWLQSQQSFEQRKLKSSGFLS